jgi:hypothetical protein
MPLQPAQGPSTELEKHEMILSRLRTTVTDLEKYIREQKNAIAYQKNVDVLQKKSVKQTSDIETKYHNTITELTRKHELDLKQISTRSAPMSPRASNISLPPHIAESLSEIACNLSHVPLLVSQSPFTVPPQLTRSLFSSPENASAYCSGPDCVENETVYSTPVGSMPLFNISTRSSGASQYNSNYLISNVSRSVDSNFRGSNGVGKPGPPGFQI